jgi:hypothetical protein
LKFFAKLSDKRLLRRLACLYFAAWKLPLQGMPVTSAALCHQNSTVQVNDSNSNEQGRTALHVDGTAIARPFVPALFYAADVPVAIN